MTDGEIRTYIPPQSTEIAWRNLKAVVKWLLRDGRGMPARRMALIRTLRDLADKIERGEKIE